MIMNNYGIWNQLKWDEIKNNLKEGAIRKENEFVGDTTNYYAYSNYEKEKYVNE